MISINPANGEVIKEYTAHSDMETAHKIKETHDAWMQWRGSAHEERSRLLTAMGNVLRERKSELARLMAMEMGKPLKQGVAEAEKCAAVCDYYAANGANFLKDQLVETDASKSFITFQPIGVVLAIMPWNFPFWQVFRFLAPALAAGNCGVLKHASNVPGCALAIEDIVSQAGFPDYVFQTLMVNNTMDEKIIENPLIQAVT